MEFHLKKWTPKVAEKIARAAGSDIDLIAADVEDGFAELYEIKHGDHGPSSWAVLRLEEDANRVVVVCYEGREVREFARRVIDKARALGLVEVLFFTRHRGLPRLIKDQQPKLVEMIYSVEV